MAARDRYTEEVKCLTCGQTGKFLLSEDDHPYIQSLDLRVDKVKGDFLAFVKDGIVRALCKKCNTEIDL